MSDNGISCAWMDLGIVEIQLTYFSLMTYEIYIAFHLFYWNFFHFLFMRVPEYGDISLPKSHMVEIEFSVRKKSKSYPCVHGVDLSLNLKIVIFPIAIISKVRKC